MKKQFLAVLFLLCAAFAVCAQAQEMTLKEIEELWEIEDSSQEAAEPLVTKLYNGDDRLGYDAESDTFFCTLGNENGDEWPAVSIHAEDETLALYWEDDYTQDSCAQAIEDGTAYEAMAWDGNQYRYFHVVFTGLPIIVLDSQEDIETEYVACTADIAAAGYEAIHSKAASHLRAGGDVHEYPKVSYRVEFRKKDGEKKHSVSLLGMEKDSDWLLLGTPMDHEVVRNALSWEIWELWNENASYESPMHRLSFRMAEVFVNNEYNGLYTVMQRVRVKKELEKLSGDPDTDCVFRTIHQANIEEDPVMQIGPQAPYCYLEKVSGPSQEDEFAQMRDFIRLTVTDPQDPDYLGDEEFIDLVQRRFDLNELYNYYLFMQMLCLQADNIQNNCYIYTVKGDDGEITYHIAPWDLDLSFKYIEYNAFMTIADRLLDLNACGSRELLWSLWKEKRGGVMSDDSFYNLVEDMQNEINRSGAYLRENMKRRGKAEQLDLKTITGMEEGQITKIEQVFNELWQMSEAGD